MTKANTFVFKALLIVAWVIFIGLCIEAGSLLLNFLFSLYKPASLHQLYLKMDLTELYHSSKFSFYSVYGFLLSILLLKAYLFYSVVRLMHNMDITQPFSPFVARRVSRISYYTLAIGLLSYAAQQAIGQSMHHTLVAENVQAFWADGKAFVLGGAVTYLIATIIQKGITVQNEKHPNV